MSSYSDSFWIRISSHLHLEIIEFIVWFGWTGFYWLGILEIFFGFEVETPGIL